MKIQIMFYVQKEDDFFFISLCDHLIFFHLMKMKK